MMDLSIRPATSADSPRLTALARTAKASWGYPAAWLEAWRGALTIRPEYIEAHTVIVAESGTRPPSVLGMCAIEDHGDHWRLEHLWVDPSAHGAGVGRALVEWALAIAGQRRPGSVVRVESDPHAAGFYRRLGAREVGAVPAPMDGNPGRVLPVFELETASG